MGTFICKKTQDTWPWDLAIDRTISHKWSPYAPCFETSTFFETTLWWSCTWGWCPLPLHNLEVHAKMRIVFGRSVQGLVYVNVLKSGFGFSYSLHPKLIILLPRVFHPKRLSHFQIFINFVVQIWCAKKISTSTKPINI